MMVTSTQELAGLRDLLQHLDDIDDIFQAVAKEGWNNSISNSISRKKNNPISTSLS